MPSLHGKTSAFVDASAPVWYDPPEPKDEQGDVR
jgi:hypothetical protein